jgi:hypothetical protein
MQDELRAERAEVARLIADLTARTDAPGGPEAARAAAAGPPTEALPAPVEPPDVTAEQPPAASVEEPGPREDDATAERPPDTPQRDATGSALVDPPGPLRAGARPAAPGLDVGPRAPRIPAWLRASRAPAAPGQTVAVEPVEEADSDPGESALAAPLQALKGLFSSNGHAAAPAEEHEPEALAVPRPRRSAAPARARAEATVHARRSAAEVWGARILAVILVVVLLTAFLLILAHIA